MLDNVVRARLTETALDFLGSSFGSLLGGFFTVEGEQTKFYLDETLLGKKVLCLFVMAVTVLARD